MGCVYSTPKNKENPNRTDGSRSASDQPNAGHGPVTFTDIRTSNPSVTLPVSSSTPSTERPESSSSPSRPLPHLPQPAPVNIVRALYEYQARQHDDLSFKKGDLMEIIGDNESKDWWLARHVGKKKEGYIPSNYVVKNDKNAKSQDWWFSVDRRDAEKMLLLPGNPRGTFLVRESSDKLSYALSVRDFINDVFIKHYRIRNMDDGGCYISAKKTFAGIIQMIEFYKNSADGLCCQLTKPCPREPVPIPFKDIEVKRSQVKLLKKLGGGQFGEVWEGTWRDRIPVAIKQVKDGQMTAEAFLSEAKIMHKLRHRRLVQLMGVCTKDSPLYIITELMPHGALIDFVRKDQGKTMNLSVQIDMAAQIADGMSYLEAQNYVHRDLRAANILVAEHQVFKVADFGLARFTEDSAIYEGGEATKFPIKWTSPEAAFDRKFSVKSDVWSFGVLLYETLTFGRSPYPGMTNHTTLEQVQQGYRMAKPSGPNIECPDSLYDIMLKCWDTKPEERPTFEFLKHLFDDYFIATEPNYKGANDGF